MKDYLELTVVNWNEIVNISTIRNLFIKELECNGSPNPHYGGYKLLAR